MTVRALAAAGLAMLALTSVASAEDLLINPSNNFYDAELRSFEGFYAGVALGVGNSGSTGQYGTLGVVAGTNYAVAESILTGVEFQGDAVWDSNGAAGIDALLLGRLGTYLGPDTMAYAAAGGGILSGTASFALGGGLEQALADKVAARGELLGTGAFGGGFDGAKGAVGLLWHMN